MREQFKQYYAPLDSEWETIWDNCIFIFDTNVLLNLFRYNKATSDDLLKVLKAIADQIWVPHQVALEYHENLQYVTIGQLNKYTEVGNVLESAKESLRDQLDQLKLEDRHYSIDPNKLIEGVEGVINDFQKELFQLKNQQPKHHAQLESEIQRLFEEKIGKAPESQDKLDAYYKEAEIRFKFDRPPGYKDRTKGADKDQSKKAVFFHKGLCYKRQYGDVLVWFQIIEEAKERQQKNVIFVTDDNKDDWWRRIGGRQMGPRYELIDEICTEANVEVFHMYTSARFLSFAKQKLNIDVKEESIEQVKVVTSRQSDITDFRRRAERAEQLVIDWLKKKYKEDDFVFHDHGYYDIVQHGASGKTAYIVKLIRSDFHVFRYLQDLSYRGFYEVSEGRFNRVTFIFIIDQEGPENINSEIVYERISRFLQRDKNLNLSSSIKYIVGTLQESVDSENNTTELRFVRKPPEQLSLLDTA
jgi:hypothetical protein